MTPRSTNGPSARGRRRSVLAAVDDDQRRQRGEALVAFAVMRREVGLLERAVDAPRLFPLHRREVVGGRVLDTLPDPEAAVVGLLGRAALEHEPPGDGCAAPRVPRCRSPRSGTAAPPSGAPPGRRGNGPGASAGARRRRRSRTASGASTGASAGSTPSPTSRGPPDGGAAGPDRGLRHLEPRGAAHRRLDGRLRGRRDEEVRLPPLQDQEGCRGPDRRRLRGDGGGADEARQPLSRAGRPLAA